ncbi:MAG: hypothetical protein ACXW0J_06005, partial [Nitrososphaeraceae archaeon]
DYNCARVSHVLLHEILRLKRKSKKEYFDQIHDLWDEHEYKNLPFIYYNEKYSKVAYNDFYRFVTIDISKL